MKAPRLIVIRSQLSEKQQAFKTHLKLCERCREAITELDLCMEGLDLWLDKEGVKALSDLADKLKL